MSRSTGRTGGAGGDLAGHFRTIVDLQLQQEAARDTHADQLDSKRCDCFLSFRSDLASELLSSLLRRYLEIRIRAQHGDLLHHSGVWVPVVRAYDLLELGVIRKSRQGGSRFEPSGAGSR